MRTAGVLYGGTSPEREVSLSSGEAVAAALEEAGLETARYDHGAPGQEEHGTVAARLQWALTDGPLLSAEVVFIALHGGAGEDGRVQGMLEMAGVPYTGTGVLGSAVSMDKWVSKNLMRQAGLPVPEGRLWSSGEPPPDHLVTGEWAGLLGWPMVVKPSAQGSTVGLSVVDGPEGMAEAVEEASAYGPRVLVERFVRGREVTVAVLEGRALPPIEIHPEHGIYDYECKYTPGMSSYTCPAVLEPEGTRRVQEIALAAFEVLGHRDYSRLDFRLGEDGVFYLLEGNTAPGFTATSLVPKAAAAAGIGFPGLCERLVRAAAGRDGAPL
ncbi:MAG: D-alanine--D-alanine ligase [bacterium]